MNSLYLERYIFSFQFKKFIPKIRAGYTVTILERVTEGKKSRIQRFQGIVISNHHENKSTHNILLRRKFDEFWIEKRFFLHSPMVEEIKVDAEGHARRANLFYLREYKGLAEKLRRLKK